MSEHSTNHPNAPKTGAAHAVRKLSCEQWEAMLVDFLDGTLTASDTELFRAHDGACENCAKLFSESQQGHEWLTFLRAEPAVPPALMSKILAQTAGALVDARLHEVFHGKPASATAVPADALPGPLPFWKRVFRAADVHRLTQPRLLMTAAMAFFSITLTLNMAGVRLGAVHLADLKPSAISTNLDKQYHMATARVVRYYDSLRFVYEMEARVRELRRDADLDNSTPAAKPQPADSTTPQDGGHKNGGKSEGPSATQPNTTLWGERVEAALTAPWLETYQGNSLDPSSAPSQNHKIGSNSKENKTASQAERGLA